MYQVQHVRVSLSILRDYVPVLPVLWQSDRIPQLSVRRDGFTCGQCLKEGTLYTNICCYMCNTYRGKDSWTTISSISEDQTVDSLAICNSCYKPWLRQYEQPIPRQLLDQQRKKMEQRKNPKR